MNEMAMFWCYLIAVIGTGLYEIREYIKYGKQGFEGLLTIMLPFPLGGLLYIFWLIVTA